MPKQVIIIFLFLFSQRLVAQLDNAIQFTIEDGLPSNSVYCVEQDDDGFIWLGTDAGLSRYDGYEFINYGLNEGVPDVEVLKFFKDSNGRIWLYTLNGKVGFIVHGTVYNSQNNTLLNGADFSSRITSIVEKNGVVYISSEFSGLRAFADQPLNVTVPSNKTNYLIRLDGDIYHMQYDFDQLEINELNYDVMEREIEVSKHVEKSISELQSPISRILYAGSYGKNYLIGVNGSGGFRQLVLIDKRNWSVTFSDPFPFRFNNIVDTQEQFFLLSEFGFMAAPNDPTELVMALSVPNPTSRIEDFQGNKWVTTLADGAFVQKKGKINKVGGSIEAVSAMDTKYDSILYLCYNESQVGRYVPSLADSPSMEFAYDGKIVKGLEVEDDGDVWILSYDFLRKNGRRVQNYHTAGSVLKADHALISSGSYDHVKVLNVLRETEVQVPLSYQKRVRIEDFEFLGSDTILMAADAELYWIDVKNQTVTTLSSFANLSIKHISQDMYGSIWLTVNAGVIRIPGELIEEVSGSELDRYLVGSSSVYNRVLLVDSIAYLSHPLGIDKLHFDGQQILNSVRISSSDGFISGEINDLEYLDGMIYLAQDNGLFTFPHAEPFMESAEFPVFIDQVIVGDSIFSMDDPIRFTYGAGPMSIVGKGINYKHLGNLSYQFRLFKNGVDDMEWRASETNQFLFSNLPPGSYTFQFRAKVPGSDWTKVAQVTITIMPLFWQTIWFKAVIGLLVLSVLFGTSFLINQSINRRKTLSRQKTLSDLKALKAQINPHFLFNSLNSIQSFVLEGSQEIAEEYLVEYGKLIRLILNHSNTLTVPIQDEIELIKTYMSLEQRRLEKTIHFSIILGEEINEQQINVPSMIIQPLLENSIWHGIQPLEEEGIISLTFTMQGTDRVSVNIKDNGIGFKQKNGVSSAKPRGLALIEERIKLINQLRKIDSDFEIDSSVSGTEINFSYPIDLE